MTNEEYTANKIYKENQKDISDTISDLLAKDRTQEILRSLE